MCWLARKAVRLQPRFQEPRVVTIRVTSSITQASAQTQEEEGEGWRTAQVCVGLTENRDFFWLKKRGTNSKKLS